MDLTAVNMNNFKYCNFYFAHTGVGYETEQQRTKHGLWGYQLG